MERDTKTKSDAARAVGALAYEKNLDLINTGGGLEYFTKTLGRAAEPIKDAPIMVLGVPGDAGGPERLDEPATVTLYFTNDHWDDGIRFEFDEARQAIDFMAGNQARGLDKVVWQ